MKAILPTVLVAALLLGACSTSPEAALDARERRAQKEFVTGSNVPRSNPDPAFDGVKVYDRSLLERVQGSGSGVPMKGDGL